MILVDLFDGPDDPLSSLLIGSTPAQEHAAAVIPIPSLGKVYLCNQSNGGAIPGQHNGEACCLKPLDPG
jgi:hypothetical protein